MIVKTPVLKQARQTLYQLPESSKRILICTPIPGGKRQRYQYYVWSTDPPPKDAYEMIEWDRGCMLYWVGDGNTVLPFTTVKQQVGPVIYYPHIWFDSGESCARYIQCQFKLTTTPRGYYPTSREECGRIPYIGAIWTAMTQVNKIYHHEEDAMEPTYTRQFPDPEHMEHWLRGQCGWTKVQQKSPLVWQAWGLQLGCCQQNATIQVTCRPQERFLRLHCLGCGWVDQSTVFTKYVFPREVTFTDVL